MSKSKTFFQKCYIIVKAKPGPLRPDEIIYTEMEESISLERPRRRKLPKLRDNSRRARTLILVFWIFIAITVIAVISDYLELQLLKRIMFGALVTEETTEANDLRQGVMGILQTGIYIATVIVFLLWFGRAYANLGRLGVRLQHKRGMAFYAWIIPFACLFWPVQIMKEIWSKTQGVIRKKDPFYIISSGSLAIGFWWLLFVFSNFIGKYVISTSWNSETIEDYIRSTEAYLVSDLLQIPEALLVIFIVSRVSGMENRMLEEVYGKERSLTQEIEITD